MLRTLDLSDNTIGDKGLQDLAATRSLKRLRTLNISSNRFTSTGLMALAEAKAARCLMELNLGDGGEGPGNWVQALTQSPYFRLRSIYTRPSPLDDSGQGEQVSTARLATLLGYDYPCGPEYGPPWCR